MGASIKTGADYEAGMSQVAATMGIDNQSEDYKLLSDTAKEMGKSTKFSAAESAEALNYLALAGYDAEKACNALPTILNLAAAGGMELAAASDMVTDSMSALGIEATQENLEQFGGQLAKISYVGRNALDNAQIIKFNTSHPNTIWGTVICKILKKFRYMGKIRDIF